MNALIRTSLRGAPKLRVHQRSSAVRWSSAQTSPSSKPPPSKHVEFYKILARPLAKVLLVATLTYQVAYWGWVYLEKEEIKKEKTEIKQLEEKLGELTKGRTGST